MSFSDAAAYDAFMGRYSIRLAPPFADLAGVADGRRALDVGCGSGVLTGELTRRVGASPVTAVDPSAPFVAWVRERFPNVRACVAAAEELPFETDAFETALAQLVVHFMTDPVMGLAEMRRVTRPGGVVAACVWDHAGGQGPLSTFWRAARELDPRAIDESHLPGARHGHLTELMKAAGLRDVEETALTASVEHPTFDEWWEPFTRGVGPAGAYVASRTPNDRDALRRACLERLPDPPFTVHAVAWAARGTA